MHWINFISSIRDKKGILNNDSLIWRRKWNSYFVIKPLHTKERTLIQYQRLKTQIIGNFRCKIMHPSFFCLENLRKNCSQSTGLSVLAYELPIITDSARLKNPQPHGSSNVAANSSSTQMSCGIYKLDSVVQQLTNKPKHKSGQKQVLKHDH